VKQRAHFFRAPGAERPLEPVLRFQPSLHPNPEARLAGRGQPPLFASPIATALLDGDQAVALQWPDVSAERGSVMTISEARALIVIGPKRRSVASTENCVVRSRLGANQ
jgi:hypothetical protein